MGSAAQARGVLTACRRAALAFAFVLAVAPLPALAADHQPMLTEARVPGLSMAIIRNGKVVEASGAGVRNATKDGTVDAHTIFDAASLSKPVFAYAVLQLVDAGTLALDAPLATYVPGFVANDPRAAEITIRHVLSHTTGLPNFRSTKWPLKTHFVPGERFSYSGEGVVWLQRVAETVTGEALETLMRRLVFAPLQMNRSSFLWRPAFDENYADPHDAALVPSAKNKRTVANAAGSLQTTAADYARFVQAVLSGARLKRETARAWLTPQVAVRHHCYQCLAPDLADTDTRLAWGLGWGLQPAAGTFFHWGDNRGFKAYVMGSVRNRSAVVIFTNGANGLSIMPELVAETLRTRPAAFDWLDIPLRTAASPQ